MARNTNKFVELLKPHYNDALKYARALCAGRSPALAEDVLQDTLLKALENFGSLRDEEKFRSWLFTILTREFYSSARKNFWKRFLPLEDYAQAESIPELYDRHENNERKELLQKALSKLSAKERSTLLLFEIAGFSIEEIKESLGEGSISAVKSRLSRTREKLKRIITALEDPKTKNFSVRGYESNPDINSGDLTNETIRLIAETEQRS